MAFVLAIGASLTGSVAADVGLPWAPANFVAVSDGFDTTSAAGCGAVTVADSSTAKAVTRLPRSREGDPGQITATDDGSLIVTLSNDQGWFVHVMLRNRLNGRWSVGTFFDGLKPPFGGAIAISPDDKTMLVAEANSVWKYDVANIMTTSLGPVEKLKIDPSRPDRLHWTQATVAAAIKYTADSRTAFVVANDGYVYELDVDAMAWRGDRIAYRPVATDLLYRTRRTFATLSPDERWLIVNGGGPARATGLLNLIDLREGRASLVETSGVRETWGVDFSAVGGTRGLLAVHGRSDIVVYDFRDGVLIPVAGKPIPQPGEYPWRDLNPPQGWQARFAALAWSGDGRRLIANRGGGHASEWRVMELTPEQPPQLRVVDDFDSCMFNGINGRWPPGIWPAGVDVVTRQKRPTLTITPTPSDTPTATPTRTVTLSPSPTPTPTSTTTSPPPSPTHTASVTPSATPTATPVPVPLFMPVALREHCTPGTQRVDVALVLDASTSMRDGRTSTGRTRLTAAIDAADAFVATLTLPQDQAAVVAFSDDAQVVQQLTGRRADINAALDRIPQLVHQQTRIDRGIEAAHEELMSPRHNPVNQAVMIVLTDGLANPEPASTAVRRAQAAKDDGITIFTIGLGRDDALNIAEIAQMASRPEYFYRAPDGEDLRQIYETIAVTIPCPAEEFWGRR